MNAAARLVHQRVLSRHLVFIHLLTRQQMTILGLACAVLLSALAVVYVTHHSRVIYAQYQHHLTEQRQLQVQRSQLLLERSTWMMQARIQQLAENKLSMVFPSSKSVIVIRE